MIGVFCLRFCALKTKHLWEISNYTRMADTTIDTNQPAEGEVLEENEEEIVDETTEESTEKELRENLVQNAVSFLSHDTVKNTPLVRRIAFLEKKGLTSEEITEALRRVSSTSTVAPKPNNTLNQRKPVVANKSVPLRAPRQPINRTPLPPPLPPPPPPKPLWRTVATTIILTLSAVGGISFFYKLLVSRLFQNSQLQLKNQSNINEISTRLPTEQENLSNRTPNARQNINNNRNMENNANNNNLDNNRKLELDVSELKKTVSELHSTLREIKELRTPLSSPMSSNNMNNMNNNTNAQTPLRSQGSQLRSSSSNNNNSSNHSNSNINNNNNNNNNINNNNTNNPSPSPKSMYQPFATKKASFSDILTRVSNGEEIPGIKEVDDAPSNQSLPPPSQSGSSKVLFFAFKSIKIIISFLFI